MIEKVMSCMDALKWPSFSSFILVWAATALLTWATVCTAAFVFRFRALESGLVPYWILLVLALIPIAMVTVAAQTVLFAIGRVGWPDSPETEKRLVLFGTPVGTWLCLSIITWIAGGPDSFVPRI